jgi:hypothetical protein
MMDPECSGCEVEVELDGRSYCSALLTTDPQNLFKEKLCPCRKCIVKATCVSRKSNIFQCKLFSEKIKEISSMEKNDESKNSN